MNTDNTRQENSKTEANPNSLKAVAIEIFKKSQRLPPLSLLMRKKGKEKQKRSSERLHLPPHAFEFADFYHL